MARPEELERATIPKLPVPRRSPMIEISVIAPADTTAAVSYCDPPPDHPMGLRLASYQRADKGQIQYDSP